MEQVQKMIVGGEEGGDGVGFVASSCHYFAALSSSSNHTLQMVPSATNNFYVFICRDLL